MCFFFLQKTDLAQIFIQLVLCRSAYCSVRGFTRLDKKCTYVKNKRINSVVQVLFSNPYLLSLISGLLNKLNNSVEILIKFSTS